MDLNTKVETFREKIRLHVLFEYPQIDWETREDLAYELSLILAGTE